MKEGQTHYQVPVEITDTEIEALQEVVGMYIAEERRSCAEYIFEETGEEGDPDSEDAEVWNHVYYALKSIQGLLDRINKKQS